MKIHKLPGQCHRDDEHIVMENIAQNIMLARLSVGMSQKELANEIGFKSPTAISLIETGHRGITCAKLWLISQITKEPIKNFFLKGLIPSGNETAQKESQ